MTPIGESRPQHELRMGWRPLVIVPVATMEIGNSRHLHQGRTYDAMERAGQVYAMVGSQAVEVEAAEYAVLAWGLSEECLRRIGTA